MFVYPLWSNNYRPNAIDFDGSTYYSRGADLTDNSDGQKGIASFWYRPDADIVAQYILGNADNRVRLRALDFSPNELFQIFLANSSGTTILDLRSTNTLTDNGTTWYHVLASWDLSVPTAKIYINDSDETNTTTLSSGTADYTSTDWFVGDGSSGTQKANGCLAELYFNVSSYLDLTVTSNRRKFISVIGKPVNLGSIGQSPTGSQPILYLKNPFGSFGTNSGSGGNFTLGAGTAADCSNRP